MTLIRTPLLSLKSLQDGIVVNPEDLYHILWLAKASDIVSEAEREEIEEQMRELERGYTIVKRWV